MLDGLPFGMQQLDETLSISGLVDDRKSPVDDVAVNAFDAQLVRNLDSSPTVKLEPVIDECS